MLASEEHGKPLGHPPSDMPAAWANHETHLKVWKLKAGM